MVSKRHQEGGQGRCRADGGEASGCTELSIECSIGGTGGKYLRQLGLKSTLNASVATAGWAGSTDTRSAEGTYDSLMVSARMAMPSQHDVDRTDRSNIDCASGGGGEKKKKKKKKGGEKGGVFRIELAPSRRS